MGKLHEHGARGEAGSEMSLERDPALSPWHSGTLVLWAVLFAVWMMANSTLSPAVAVLGLVLTFGLAVLFARRSEAWRRVRPGVGAAFGFLAYTATFFFEMAKANLAMLRHVYAPAMAIRPGVVDVRTRLRSPMGRLALANSIALTPGSLIIDLSGERLVLHWLDVQTTDVEAVSALIASPFEQRLEKVFG